MGCPVIRIVAQRAIFVVRLLEGFSHHLLIVLALNNGPEIKPCAQRPPSCSASFNSLDWLSSERRVAIGLGAPMEIAPDRQRRFRVIGPKKAFNLFGTGAIVGWLFNFPQELREAVRQGLHRAVLFL
jgi:hypothetical protein